MQFSVRTENFLAEDCGSSAFLGIFEGKNCTDGAFNNLQVHKEMPFVIDGLE